MKKYFNQGYSYKTILHLLRKKYDIEISLRTFSRIIEKEGMKRKNMNES